MQYRLIYNSIDIACMVLAANDGQSSSIELLESYTHTLISFIVNLRVFNNFVVNLFRLRNGTSICYIQMKHTVTNRLTACILHCFYFSSVLTSDKVPRYNLWKSHVHTNQGRMDREKKQLLFALKKIIPNSNDSMTLFESILVCPYFLQINKQHSHDYPVPRTNTYIKLSNEISYERLHIWLIWCRWINHAFNRNPIEKWSLNKWMKSNPLCAVIFVHRIAFML